MKNAYFNEGVSESEQNKDLEALLIQQPKSIDVKKYLWLLLISTCFIQGCALALFIPLLVSFLSNTVMFIFMALLLANMAANLYFLIETIILTIKKKLMFLIPIGFLILIIAPIFIYVVVVVSIRA